jgi:hypothetical protein
MNAPRRGLRAIGAVIGALVVALGSAAGPALAVVPPFSDVAGHKFEADIEWLRLQEITSGCGGGRFCPDGLVTRAQMASFLDRALDLPATSADPFTDDEGSTHEAAINRVAAAGITFGCDTDLFCPNGRVTRAQMASFLARAFDLDASSIDWFADDDRSSHQGNINRIAWAGITVGCGASIYCPNGMVTRGQMAAFLHRAIAAPRTPPSCTLFPATNVWNRRVDSLPVASNSSTLINTIGAGSPGHPDFGEYLGYGIPYNVVNASTPRSSVSFTWPSESDAGPYPIPPSPKTEGGSDRHILMWDVGECRLYELFAAQHTSSGWHAGSGAIWNLRSNALRPDGWTSADAAGLPILPGLVRYEEVAAGAINHAIRFTAPVTRDAHIYPARHHAGDGTSSSLPSMGTRVRLKAGFDMSDYSPRMRVILVAMQRYGMILADNGSPWYFSGVSDVRWDDEELNELKDLRGSDFEVVNTSGFVNGG